MPLSEKQRAQLIAGPYTRLLAEHEEAMAALYSTFADAITEAKPFWQIMSTEEMGHKALILKIDEKLRSGEWKFRRPVFITSSIIDSLEWISARRKDIEKEGISMREALKMALKLETGMIESSFFDVLKGDNAEMIEAVQTQTAYTRAHVQRLQKEAKRLKWKIFGKRRLFPKVEAKSLTREELKNNIKASQANMLGMLISMEEAASRLYNTYGQRFDDKDNFWAKFGAEELQHATMLRTMYKLLEDGKLFHNVEHFNRKALEDMVEFILNAEFDARHDQVSHHEAVSTALKIELSMLERGFYSVVTSDAEEFQIIASRLVKLTKAHTARLEAEMLRVRNLGDSAREKLPFKSQDA